MGENFGWGSVMLSYSSPSRLTPCCGNGWREDWLKRLEAEPFHGAGLGRRTRLEGCLLEARLDL